MDSKLVQPENASEYISLTLAGMFIAVSDVQPENAISIVVTPFGIVIDFKLLQLANVYEFIRSTPLGIFMLLRLVQPWNAPSPISVTVSAISTLSSSTHS